MNIHDIKSGDKLIIVNKLIGLFEKGDIVTVTNVYNDTISFTFGENNANTGFMDFATCEEHFKKVEEMVAKVEVPKITEEYIMEIMENSEFETTTVFDKCTIVSCRLPNGFVITESSACVNPEDYDVEIGEEICIDKIADKIWELEAYRLQQWLWEEKMFEDCPHGCDDCVNCTCGDCETDECLDTDLDCDDCNNHNCHFNSKK